MNVKWLANILCRISLIAMLKHIWSQVVWPNNQHLPLISNLWTLIRAHWTDLFQDFLSTRNILLHGRTISVILGHFLLKPCAYFLYYSLPFSAVQLHSVFTRRYVTHWFVDCHFKAWKFFITAVTILIFPGPDDHIWMRCFRWEGCWLDLIRAYELSGMLVSMELEWEELGWSAEHFFSKGGASPYLLFHFLLWYGSHYESEAWQTQNASKCILKYIFPT